MNLRNFRWRAAVAVLAVAASIPALGSGPAWSATTARGAAPAAHIAAAEFPLVRAAQITLAHAGGCAITRLRAVARTGRVACVEATRSLAAPALCSPGRVRHDRHAGCGEVGILYRVVQVPSGKVLGTGTVAVLFSAQLNALSRTWSMETVIDLTSATGVVRVGTTAIRSIRCSGGCTASGPATVLLRVGAPHAHAFRITSPGTATRTTSQNLILELLNPAATVQAPPVKLPALGPARCDSAIRRTQGCVFSDVAGQYVLHLHGQGIDAVAAHIERAQRTKPHHFGWFGHGPALTHTTNQAIQRRNRAAACRGIRRRPGLSCDEYPFAATLQGASFFPGDSSAVLVPAVQNSREGGFRSGMIIRERILNGDHYFVFIV